MGTNEDREYVTGGEFARWMQEESSSRLRIEARLDANAAAVATGLDKIDRHLTELNSRTRKNSEAIAVIEREIEAIKSNENGIDEAVQTIRTSGCAQLAAHRSVLAATATVAEWSTRKKAAVVGGISISGAVMWTVVQRVAEAIIALRGPTP